MSCWGIVRTYTSKLLLTSASNLGPTKALSRVYSLLMRSIRHRASGCAASAICRGRNELCRGYLGPSKAVKTEIACAVVVEAWSAQGCES